MRSDHTPVVRTLSGSPYRSFSEFFTKNGTAAQSFLINPARRTTIIGAQGTRLTFFPFSLCDVFGNPVQEEVEIKLIEIFSRPMMLCSGKVSTSQDRFLETAGLIFLQGVQNLLPLELSRPVAVELPVAPTLRNPLGMRLFAGSTSTTRPFSAEKVFDWKPVANQDVRVRKIGDRKHFTFELDHFNWFSCSYLFAKRSHRTMVSARMISPVNNPDDQVALLAFKEVNAVGRMYLSGNKFTLFNVPANMPASLVIMGLKGGQLFYGQSDLEKTSSQLVRVHMEAISEPELVEALVQL